MTSTTNLEDLRQTVGQHSIDINELRRDIGQLHKDNADIKTALNENTKCLSHITDTLARWEARDKALAEAKPKERGIAYWLSTIATIFVLAAAIQAAVGWYISNQIWRDTAMLREASNAHSEFVRQWQHNGRLYRLEATVDLLKNATIMRPSWAAEIRPH